MLSSFPIAMIVGIILGFLSGLGIGGGSLLIIWLTSVLGWNISAARTTNLLFFLPAAVIACFIRYRQGVLQKKGILLSILSGCIAAILGTILSYQISTELLQKLFGILLLIAGIRELCYRERNAR